MGINNDDQRCLFWRRHQPNPVTLFPIGYCPQNTPVYEMYFYLQKVETINVLVSIETYWLVSPVCGAGVVADYRQGINPLNKII